MEDINVIEGRAEKKRSFVSELPLIVKIFFLCAAVSAAVFFA